MVINCTWSLHIPEELAMCAAARENKEKSSHFLQTTQTQRDSKHSTMDRFIEDFYQLHLLWISKHCPSWLWEELQKNLLINPMIWFEKLLDETFTNWLVILPLYSEGVSPASVHVLLHINGIRGVSISASRFIITRCLCQSPWPNLSNFNTLGWNFIP